MQAFLRARGATMTSRSDGPPLDGSVVGTMIFFERGKVAFLLEDLSGWQVHEANRHRAGQPATTTVRLSRGDVTTFLCFQGDHHPALLSAKMAWLEASRG